MANGSHQTLRFAATINMRSAFCLVGAVATLCSAIAPAFEQPVEKVADFFTTLDGDGMPYGGVLPLDRVTQAGTNLWFTTERGGTWDAGTLSRFDLVTREIVQFLSLDTRPGNNLGARPEGAVLVIGDEAYFTTKQGGAGDQGSIVRVNLVTGFATNLYSFPENTAALRNAGLQTGSTPRGGLTLIGDDLWCMTSAGGISNRGTVVKFNLTTHMLTVVTNFDGPQLGGQPYGSFVKVGDAYYFNTFTGGSTFGTTSITPYTLPDGSTLWTTNTLSLGAGTLSRMTFDESGNPQFARLIDLPGGFCQFPNSEPTPGGTNYLFFPTSGPNATPGAIVRYEISTGKWTNVWLFPTNAIYQTNWGTRPGFNGLTEWQNELYFVNRLGGVSNLGTIVKYSIPSNRLTKLTDLTGVHPDSLGNPGTGANVGTVVSENDRYYMYFPLARGGANDPAGFTTGLGTLVRIPLPPPPIQLSLTPAENNELTLSWTGGYPPFTVEAAGDPANLDWTKVLEGVTNRSVTITNVSERAFFRVGGRD